MTRFKEFLKACVPYIITAFPFVMMDAFIRIMAIKVNYMQFAMVLPSIIFSLIWVGLITAVTTSLPRLAGRIVYGVVFAVYFLLFLTNSIYFSYTDFFFSFNLLSMADAGSAYIWSTVKGASPLIYLFCVAVIAAAVYAIIKLKPKKRTSVKVILISAVTFVIAHLLTPFLYGPAYDTLKWDAWRNPHNVYNNFNDANKSIKVCGFYEYCFKDFCNTFLKAEPKKTPEEQKLLTEAFAESTTHKENDCSGIFEGKNVIFLQLEGIDSWLLTKEDMPNLYKLKTESIDFTNHYSYYTGGGSTFNSELAVNTGFITPITFYRNPYSFTTNSYPYSLPKTFKALGYSVNAFHMNTGEYYSRKPNYVNWGYDNYYGLLDVAKYSDKSYELDRELILNKTLNDAMFSEDGPFLHYIISYTPHTPFSTDDYKAKVLAKEKYGEVPDLSEEECARLYASETDNMVGLLVEELEKRGLLENTVIVAYADHYLYTLNDKSILDKNGKTTENNLINQTPFFIWSKDVTPTTVEKVNSQIDILPTVLNMFGIEYTEQNFIGRDIFDDNYAGYVFFSDYSWYDGNVYVENGKVLSGSAPSDKYITKMSELISELILKNDLVQKYDHFKGLKK